MFDFFPITISPCSPAADLAKALKHHKLYFLSSSDKPSACLIAKDEIERDDILQELFSFSKQFAFDITLSSGKKTLPCHPFRFPVFQIVRFPKDHTLNGGNVLPAGAIAQVMNYNGIGRANLNLLSPLRLFGVKNVPIHNFEPVLLFSLTINHSIDFNIKDVVNFLIFASTSFHTHFWFATKQHQMDAFRLMSSSPRIQSVQLFPPSFYLPQKESALETELKVG